MDPEENRLCEADAMALREVAWDSVREGTRHSRAAVVAVADFSAPLRELGASFVTLRKGAALRGCMGSLEARMPLVEDVARNAYNAGFNDPRFEPVREEEHPELSLKLSVLGAPVPFPVESEPDLLERLVPGTDGLILREGGRRATFLPAVWQSVASPAEFVSLLKRKAGLPRDYWSERLEVFRYRADEY